MHTNTLRLSFYLFIIESAIEHGKLYLKKKRQANSTCITRRHSLYTHAHTHSGIDQLVPCQACKQECKNFANSIEKKILLFLQRMRFDAALMHTQPTQDWATIKKPQQTNRNEMKITHTRAQVFRWNRYVRFEKNCLTLSWPRTVQAAFECMVRARWWMFFEKHTIPTVGNAQLIELFVFIVQSTGKLKLKPKTTTIYFHSLSYTHLHDTGTRRWSHIQRVSLLGFSFSLPLRPCAVQRYS